MYVYMHVSYVYIYIIYIIYIYYSFHLIPSKFVGKICMFRRCEVWKPGNLRALGSPRPSLHIGILERYPFPFHVSEGYPQKTHKMFRNKTSIFMK